MKKQAQIFAVFVCMVAMLFAVNARADIVVGGTLQSWVEADVLNNIYNTPYWDGNSTDGYHASIGNYLTKSGYFASYSSSPDQAFKYFGNSGGTAVTDMYFTKTGTGQQAAMQIEVAGLSGSNTFGWYDIDTGVQTIIFTGSNGAGANAEFTPSANYGFYLISDGKTYYTQSSKNTSDQNAQHFAIFQQTGDVYWLGIEDLVVGSAGGDKDYNDMVVKVSSVPTPIPAAFWLFGSGLIGIIGIRRRQTK